MVPTATPLPEGKLPPEHMPDGLVVEPFAPAANYPVAFAIAPDGTLFYNELRTGNIRIVKNGQLPANPFYNFKVSGQPEAGLIGLTLDPDFANNHYVYVFYTSVPDGQDNGGPNGPNEVVRLTDVADKGSELTYILQDLPSAPIHNSGTLRFGPDGKLYVALGDNDQGSNAQDLGVLPGKILRVNADGSIPADNPRLSDRRANKPRSGRTVCATCSASISTRSAINCSPPRTDQATMTSWMWWAEPAISGGLRLATNTSQASPIRSP